MSILRPRIFLALCMYFTAFSLFSQGTINAPAHECLGNITSFSYSPPPGLTLSSANWNFGDGFNSSFLTPAHTYANKGTYTVTIQATFTNSTSATDTFILEVVGLPTAAYVTAPKSDSCYNDNNVCYVDVSTPAATGQDITQRLFVWGDGSFDNNNVSPKQGDTLCHNYAVMDKYYLRMEVTDKYGCKNSVGGIINIVENITANFMIDTSFVDCNTLKVCVRNYSFGATPQTAHYRWYFDSTALDTGSYFTTKKCVTYQKSKLVKITLIAHANNGCIDTMIKTRPAVITPLPKELILDDTVFCSIADQTSGAQLSSSPSADAFRWYFDGNYNAFITSFAAIFDVARLPGMHSVKAEVVRGSCVTTYTKNYLVRGPLAGAMVIDDKQCGGQREVYFIDVTQGIDRNNCKFRWDIIDPFGQNCVNNRLRDVNKYTNCNASIDWYTRHTFKADVKADYKFKYRVTDTTTGCSDEMEGMVSTKYCAPILGKDSIHLCKGGFFLDNVLPPDPIDFSLDTGKTWKRFGMLLDTSYQGVYKVGYVFRTLITPWAEVIGDDSIKVHKDTIILMDTVYKEKQLYIHPNKRDTLSLKIYNNCRPYRVTVGFKNGSFLKKEYLSVNWGDSGNYDHKFFSDSTVDSITHIYNISGVSGGAVVYMENEYGCSTRTELPIQVGKFFSKFMDSTVCLGNISCMYPYVYDTRISTFWTGNSGQNKVSWKFSDTSGVATDFAPCHKFTHGGKHEVKMIIDDDLGCKDTLRDSIFVQDIRADVKRLSKFIYCSELKQFFDSSAYIHYKGDSIVKYSWQFGDGVFSSFKKNPLQSITTSLDVIKARHAVQDRLGCSDTVDFDIQVIGPKPYFLIKDTIGCGSLDAVFRNLSRNCKQYIWQYGDSMQSTYQTASKADVNFLYNKPGRYFISLIGIDTIFNPFTNSLQYCYNTFPDKLFQKDTTRSVLVLPYHGTGMSGPDTICLGTPLVLTSKTDTAYDFDEWSTGDTNVLLKQNPGSSLNHIFRKEGSYNVTLRPGYNNAIYNHCRDSAKKTIVVLSVKSAFDIDPVVIPPQFQFYNKSAPSGAALKWDFGQPASGTSNNSTDQDPTHNYGNDTGTYSVCLITTIPFGCADTTCKDITNDHLADFGIFNVFTPGKLDEKNDKYDILVEGEDLYELYIYDRWGVLVFEGHKDADNTQPDGNWNGKLMNTGPDCPGGTYYYIFKYSLRTKPTDIRTITGVITLIR